MSEPTQPDPTLRFAGVGTWVPSAIGAVECMTCRGVVPRGELELIVQSATRGYFARRSPCDRPDCPFTAWGQDVESNSRTR